MARIPRAYSKAWDRGEVDYFRGGYNSVYSVHPLEQAFYAKGYLNALRNASSWLSEKVQIEQQISDHLNF